MDGFVRTIGSGIVGFIEGAFDAVGGVLRGLFGAANQALPGGMLFVVLFIVALFAAWTLAKR